MCEECEKRQIDMLEDRVGQVNWIRQIAGDLKSTNNEGTGREIVEYWLEQCTEQGDPPPEWFDNHDKNFLIDLVSE